MEKKTNSKDRYENDLKLYKEFSKAWADGTLESSNKVYQLLQKWSSDFCKKYKCEQDADDMLMLCIDILLKNQFSGMSSLKTHVWTIMRRELLKRREAKKSMIEIGDNLIDRQSAVVTEEILRDISSDELMGRLLLSLPNLQKEIVRVILDFETDRAPSKKEIICEIQKSLEGKFTDYAIERAFDHVVVVLEGEFSRVVERTRELRSRSNNIFSKETDLLHKINTVFSAEERQRYNELYSKFQEENLTERERTELTKLSEKFEILNARRLEYLGELAKLRRQSLRDVVKDLGIKP